VKTTAATTTTRTISTLADVHGNRTVYSWVNCAAYNRDPSGDYGAIYLDRAQRDAALTEVRAWAVERGLSEPASRSGIYPVKMTAAKLRKVMRDTLPEAIGVEA
jgi:hypothetical protein